MFRYRNVSRSRFVIPSLGIVVEPGDVFESPFTIDDGNYELVKERKAAADTAAKEDK